MRKMTLLEMVQNIASALDTDEVNSITDTVESLQIAEVIRETYYEQFNNIYIPELQGLFKLSSVNLIESPNYLSIPEDVNKIFWIKYKNFRADETFQPVEYIHPEEFMNRQLMFNASGSNIILTRDINSGVEYYIRSDVPPQHFTMFDDEYVVFDSFDLAYETTVEGPNAICFGCKSPVFEMQDDFVPPIDGSLFPLLLAESKATCFINIKQVSSAKEERKASRQRIRMQNDQFKSRQAQYAYWERGPSFARNRK